jgi:L-ascorbate metabolism protein UlaG (beta-lactamase superfamily)
VVIVESGERKQTMTSNRALQAVPQRCGLYVGRWLGALLALLAPGVLASGALAQCYPIAEGPAQVLPAAYREAALAPGSVQLTFLGHSSFLIETPQGARAITDYTGQRGPDLPDIVTMNNAHSSHYTDFPDPKIAHVLRGWTTVNEVTLYDVTSLDLHVRNVPTNVRELGGARMNGNSIFVFEIADLCLAHLGHLHHTLTDVHLGELGQIDVLLVPADGSFTMAHELMAEVIDQIRPAVVIPMHYFSAFTLSGFLERLRDRYEVVIKDEPTITLTRATLPYRQVVVLPGG